jgi:hypothetical protein
MMDSKGEYFTVLLNKQKATIKKAQFNIYKSNIRQTFLLIKKLKNGLKKYSLI